MASGIQAVTTTHDELVVDLLFFLNYPPYSEL